MATVNALVPSLSPGSGISTGSRRKRKGGGLKAIEAGVRVRRDSSSDRLASGASLRAFSRSTSSPQSKAT